MVIVGKTGKDDLDAGINALERRADVGPRIGPVQHRQIAAHFEHQFGLRIYFRHDRENLAAV